LKPGDTAHVLAGLYREKIIVESSGSKEGGLVTIIGEHGAILSGDGIVGQDIVLLKDKNDVRIEGLEIRDNLKVEDGSGIRIQGACNHIEVVNNRIHEIRGKDAMGITVYGRNAQTPVSNLLIEGNEIYDCEPAKSEALVLNGNITDFRILNNSVHDVNNIGICMIGGEGWVNKDREKVARHGICKGNKVMRARANYDDGYAAGIYVDGGSEIVVEENEVSLCNLGIEVGAENRGTTTRAITVKNNHIFLNQKGGLVFGGYDKSAGRVEDCLFSENICFQNSSSDDANGELWIQLANQCRVEHNVFWAAEDKTVVQVVKGAGDNTLGNNTYFSNSGSSHAPFSWREQDIEGFQAFQKASKQDANSRFAKPAFRAPQKGDFTAP
jgi:hypothetical protein